ncbi:hypothetical protein [Pseudomonas shahriarae]|uniref:hypothetical protein n=1 Tax=Pseudomonas shahriarae TaxID=2745512 RepID=UPI00249CE6EB|nr:hypothetical protein [Pseudomonas shahriarae]MDI3204993.1 hypothetical protein [Pseudomonas shahriarae]MDZ4302529.1 hypothetical protein [Pseudomonas sp.]
MSNIYHYTSASSLIGMLTHSEFWATDITFLNDHQEHIHGFRAALDYIEETSKSVINPYANEVKGFYSVMSKVIEPNVMGRDTYVVSFAKDRDSISHWFSYCEKNQGYCVCFDEGDFFDEGEKLELSSGYALRFEDVTYDVSQFNSRLDKILSRDVILATIIKNMGGEGRSSIIDEAREQNGMIRQVEQIFNEIIFSTSSFKFDGFRHEVERRLVLSSKKGRFDNSYDYMSTGVRFRERGGVIFPYVPVRFNRKSIREIIIGPSGDFEIRKAGLQKLLDKYGVGCVINSSSTPLRFT